jgi:hypothetical protein
MIAKYMPNLKRTQPNSLGPGLALGKKMSFRTLALMAVAMIRPEPTYLPPDPAVFLCPRLFLIAENEKAFLELWLWTF